MQFIPQGQEEGGEEVDGRTSWGSRGTCGERGPGFKEDVETCEERKDGEGVGACMKLV